MRRALLAAVLVALMSPLAIGQSGSIVKQVTYRWDLDSTTETFAVLDHPDFKKGTNRVTTSGSSTTVTAVAGTPFDDIGVSSMLVFKTAMGPAPGLETRVVSAKASGSSITIDSAIDMSAGNWEFYYRNLTSGTGTEDGKFSVETFSDFSLDININQMAVTGTIDVRLLCRLGHTGAPFRQVYPELTPPTGTATYISYSAAGGFTYSTSVHFKECKVGAKISSADDGGDLTTNQEQITIGLTGRK